jgi:hypothetical protein
VLCCVQESNEVFDVLEVALQSHPYFKARAAAAAAAVPIPAAGTNGASVGTTPPSLSPHAASQPFAPGTTPPGDVEQHLQDTSAGGAAGTDAAAAAPATVSSDGLGPAGTASGGDAVGVGVATVVNTATMLTAVRKDRTTFMDQVAETVQRATPSSPTGEYMGHLWCFLVWLGVPAAEGTVGRLQHTISCSALYVLAPADA